LVPGCKFWFNRKTAAKQFTVKHQPDCFAGTITQVTNQLVHWHWDYDSSSCTTTRRYELLLKQKPQVVTEAQQRYLDVDRSSSSNQCSAMMPAHTSPTVFSTN
jgi:hypothetical protein